MTEKNDLNRNGTEGIHNILYSIHFGGGSRENVGFLKDDGKHAVNGGRLSHRSVLGFHLAVNR